MKTNINLIGYVLASVFTPISFFYMGLWKNWWDKEAIIEVVFCFVCIALLIFIVFIVWHLYAESIENCRNENYRQQVYDDILALEEYKKRQDEEDF